MKTGETPELLERLGLSAEKVRALVNKPKVHPVLSEHLRRIGSIGGRKSRRTLTPAQARAMVRAREQKRRDSR